MLKYVDCVEQIKLTIHFFVHEIWNREAKKKNFFMTNYNPTLNIFEFRLCVSINSLYNLKWLF
jgi:hypothetical protein